MAEADAGLVIPIGFTEKKAAQQLARIEAQALKAANQSEKAFVKANQNITKSTQGMSNQTRSQVQNVSYQLQDLFVQISSGTDASRALSQQLPQLVSGFGALGAVLGTVAAFAIPLAASFIDLGDGSKELAESVKNAESALSTYRQAMDDANLSAVQLYEKFGVASAAAQKLLDVLAATAQAEAFVAQRDALDAINQRFSDLAESVAQYRAQTDEISRENWAIDIADRFGVAIGEAERLADIMAQIDNTSDAGRRADLLAEMATILKDAAINGAELDSELIKATTDAARAALAVAEIDNANLANAGAQVDGLTVKLGTLIEQANRAAAAMGAAISAQNAAAGFELGSLGGQSVFGASSGRIITGLGGGDPLATPYSAPDFKPTRGGGGRKRSGGGGRSAADKAEEERIKQVYEDLEVAIKAAEEEADKFNDAMGEIGDTIADVIFEGENLRESLADIFKGIASDILSSGIKNALVSQFGAGAQAGGFGSFLGDLFGGFRANGGPVDPSKAYVVGERGPEVFVPQTAGNIVPNHRMGGSFSPSTTINIQGNADERTLTEIRRELDMRDKRLAAQVPSIMDTYQKRRG